MDELDDGQIGSDAWLERLDVLAGDGYGLAADMLQSRLEREFGVGPDIARQMALVELERVTEDEFATLREQIQIGTEENIQMLKAFRAFEAWCTLPNLPNVPPQVDGNG